MERANNLFLQKGEGLRPDLITYNVLMHWFCKDNGAIKMVILQRTMNERDILQDAPKMSIG